MLERGREFGRLISHRVLRQKPPEIPQPVQVETSPIPSKDVPIHLEFGEHGDKNTEHLKPLIDKLDSVLSSTPKGAVAIFVESAFSPSIKSMAVLQRTKEGLLLSEAYGQFDFVAKNLRLPDKRELKIAQETYLNESSRFEKAEILAIDNLQKKYPHRVWVLPEFAMEEDATPEKHHNFFADFEKIDEDQKNFALAGKFDKAVKVLRKKAQLVANTTRKRDITIASILRNYVSSHDENTLLIAGYIGSAHTKIFHILKNLGHSITRSFPEKEGKSYLFDPDNTAIRAVEFGASKWTDMEWKRAGIGNIMYRLVKSVNDEDNEGLTHQELIAITNASLYNLSNEDIKDIEKEAQRGRLLEVLLRKNGISLEDIGSH